MSNASDFFGGGVPNRGEFNIPLASSMGGLGDVNITDIQNDQVLFYDNGYWVNRSLTYDDITGSKPTTYTTLTSFLTSLTDVDLALPLSTGDILRYNASLSQWVATSLSELISLTQLSDVTIAGTSSTHVLRSNGSTWYSGQLSFTDLSNPPVSSDYTFTGLQQTNNTPVANGYLRWNGTPDQIDYSATIPVSVLTPTLNSIATSLNTYNTGNITAGDIDLGTTEIQAPSLTIVEDGYVLMYDQSIDAFTAQILPTSGDLSRIQDGDNNTYIDVDATTDNIVIHAGPTSGNIVLEPNGSGTVQIIGTGDAVIESNDNILITSNGNDVVIQGITYPDTPGSVGQVMYLSGAGTLGFTTISSPISTLQDLTNVTITGVSNNQFLMYDTSVPNEWVNKTPTIRLDAVGSTLSVADVLITGTPNTDQVLKWNGTDKWINAQLSYTNISGTPPLTLDQLSNVGSPTTAANASAGDSFVLYYDYVSPGVGNWEAKKLSYSDITMTGLDLSNFQDTMGLLHLEDVSDSLAPADKHVLFYDNTIIGTEKWTSKQLTYADISGTIPTPVINYNQIQGAPFSPEVNNVPVLTVNLKDLEDVEDYISITDGHVLTWDSTPGIWRPAAAPVTVTQLSQLTGDVVISAPSDNQILVYDTTNPTINRWKNTNVNVSLSTVAEVAGTITLTPQDVSISGTQTTNHVLKWNGSDWADAQLSHTNINWSGYTLTLDQLDGVVVPSPSSGDILQYNGTNWVNYTPTTPFRIDDSDDGNEGAFVDVGTDPSNVLISAGNGGVASGGNIILTPNTTTNNDAAVIIEGNGGTTAYIMSDDIIDVVSTSAVKLQGITYPDTDGSNGYVLATNGAGVASFQDISNMLPALYLTNFKTGLTLSYTTSSTITVGAGTCRSSDNTVSMTNGSNFIKSLTAGWTSGSGNAGLPTGVSLTADRFYYVFILRRSTGAVEFGFDTSKTAANLVADANVLTWASGPINYRRIGTIWTNSSSLIEDFTQKGNKFILKTPKYIYSWLGSTINASATFTTNFPDVTIKGIFLITTTDSGEVSATIADPSTLPLSTTHTNSVYDSALYNIAIGGYGSFHYEVNTTSAYRIQKNGAGVINKILYIMQSMEDSFED